MEILFPNPLIAFIVCAKNLDLIIFFKAGTNFEKFSELTARFGLNVIEEFPIIIFVIVAV